MSKPGKPPLAIRDSFTRTQLTHGIVGTPLYMAPEQWTGAGICAQTDMYALGCILYEMLAGQRPVTGRSLAALRRAHCGGDLRPLPLPSSRSKGPATPVGAILARCLALEPGKRYTSWEELEQVLAGAYQAVTAHPAPAPEAVAALSRAERVAAGWSYSAMRYSYLDIGKAEVALGYFERARAAGSAEGEPRLEAAGVGSLGIAYRQLGQTRRAIGYYEQALVIAREIGNRRGEGAALGNLGLAYADLGNARRAIGYFEQAMVIHREIGNRRGEGNGLGNPGGAYLQLGETRRAIGYYEQCLTIHREIGDRRGEGNDLGNLGLAYAALGETQRAIGYYEQASAILEEIGDVMGAVSISFNLALLLAQQGRPTEALPYAERAAQVFAQIGHAGHAQRAQQLVAQIRAALR